MLSETGMFAHQYVVRVSMCLCTCVHIYVCTCVCVGSGARPNHYVPLWHVRGVTRISFTPIYEPMQPYELNFPITRDRLAGEKLKSEQSAGSRMQNAATQQDIDKSRVSRALGGQRKHTAHWKKKWATKQQMYFYYRQLESGDHFSVWAHDIDR